MLGDLTRTHQHLLPSLPALFSPSKVQRSKMEKSFTLLQTIGAAGIFSAVSFWYGFMFGRESARKELGDLIEALRRSNDNSDTSAQDS